MSYLETRAAGGVEGGGRALWGTKVERIKYAALMLTFTSLMMAAHRETILGVRAGSLKNVPHSKLIHSVCKSWAYGKG
jgi:hypothetical protein